MSKHPQVAAVLKRQNEEIFEKVKCPHCEGEGCPKCEGKGYMTDAVDKEDEPFLKDLIKNLRKGSATHSKQADDLEKAVKEEIELDEKFKVGDKVKVKKGSMKSPSQRHYEKTVGTIVKDFKDGDFKVNFGGNDNLSIDGKLLVKEEEDELKEPFDEVTRLSELHLMFQKLPPMKIKDKKTQNWLSELVTRNACKKRCCQNHFHLVKKVKMLQTKCTVSLVTMSCLMTCILLVRNPQTVMQDLLSKRQ